MADYQTAMQQANQIAEEKLDDMMLLSWYDRDRDFESPQHSSECHADSAVPGYVDYGLYHGATLKIDTEFYFWNFIMVIYGYSIEKNRNNYYYCDKKISSIYFTHRAKYIQ